MIQRTAMQASASPVYYLGTGTGSPSWLANKSDAGDAYAPLWRVAGINRWAWYFATDEDLQLLRWNAAGVFQDLTEISAVDGSWTFPAAVRIANGLEIVAGGLDMTGNIAVTGTVDGVDVSDHSSRHDHGGADALALFGAATQGVVPASGGGVANFLRADGTWAAPPGGSGSASVAQGTVAFGSSPSNYAEVTIAAAWVTAGHRIVALVRGDR